MSAANKKEAEGETVIIIRIGGDTGITTHPKMENSPGIILGEPIALPREQKAPWSRRSTRGEMAFSSLKQRKVRGTLLCRAFSSPSLNRKRLRKEPFAILNQYENYLLER